MKKEKKRIALIGGGPSALYAFQHFINSKRTDIEITIFEKNNALGKGMPYSSMGANTEHITNISDNELPTLVTPIHEWVYTAPAELLQQFNIEPSTFNEYKVLPRLFFGEYLCAQFQLLIDRAEQINVSINLYLNHEVIDVIDKPDSNEVCIQTDKSGILPFDICIICTGHYWPKKQEGKVPGYYDSPYPPSKLNFNVDHPIAIRGSSLTAIDVLRTLSRNHGFFEENGNGILTYKLNEHNKNFKMVLHSSDGMLPAIRIHVEDSMSDSDLLTPELIAKNRTQNNGFLSLDFVFETAFKNSLKDKDPEFYQRIQHMNMETFVNTMLKLRERLDPFILFEYEYKEAEKSIHRHKPVYWKKMLAMLSFTMNYPAKYFSAEDMKRLHDSLSELISIVIAFVPQSSAKELLALHNAGILDIIEVDKDSYIDAEAKGITYHYTDQNEIPVSVSYKIFIDAIGQKHLSMQEFPFKTLIKEKKLSQAKVKFKNPEAGEKELIKGNEDVKKDTDGSYFMNVSGITINDHFQIVNSSGVRNERIYIMAVPYISGYNPDYSGLDFCEHASKLICEEILRSTFK